MNEPAAAPRCLIVVGLPASGKTEYARSLGPGWIIIDDPEGPDDLPRTLTRDTVITSPHFCRPEALAGVMREARRRWPGVTPEVVFFRNDPEACARNAMRRPGKEVRGLIAGLSRVYAPPADARPVWRHTGEG